MFDNTPHRTGTDGRWQILWSSSALIGAKVQEPPRLRPMRFAPQRREPTMSTLAEHIRKSAGNIAEAFEQRYGHPPDFTGESLKFIDEMIGNASDFLPDM